MNARRAVLLLTGALVVGGTLFAATPAQAFPGANGKIMFACNGSICTMNPDESGRVSLTSGSVDTFPAWSPDGTKIAFDSDRDGNEEIYVMNADGSGVTRLTFNPGLDRWPAWSPDGQKIAFSSDRDSNSEIYTMNADGSNATNITNYPGAYDSGPAWSPDGQKIAFTTSRDGFSEVYSMTPDGQGQTNLTHTLDADYDPNWSPDGQKIVYNGPCDECEAIYVMNADGSQKRRLSGLSSVSGDSSPAWSPDGKKVVFSSYGLSVMNADGTGRINFTNSQATDHYPDWQPLPTAAYAHPQSAPSLQASLVPTFRPCGTGANPTNGKHSPPLGTQSCLPPTPGSNVARVGASSQGSTSFTVIPGDTDATNGDQANVMLSASLTDVKTPAGADYTPNASGPDLTEITRLRLTDKANNYGGASGTATEYDFRVPLECTATSDPALGSNCSVTTSADALLPGFITEQRQAVVQAFRVRVDDAGANGTTGDSDDRIFATQGIYIP